MNRQTIAWLLYKASLKQLWQRKRMLLFPFAALVFELALFVLVFSIMLRIHFQGHLSWLWQLEAHPPTSWIYILYLLIYYTLFHAVAFFIHSFFICYYWSELTGKQIKPKYLFLRLFQWMTQFIWVDWFFNMFEARDNCIALLAEKKYGLRWRVIKILLWPVMLIEQMSPFEALPRAGALIQSHWGARVKQRSNFWLIDLILLLPIFLLIFMFFYNPNLQFRILYSGIAVFYIVILVTLYSCVSTIFQMCLYFYVKRGCPPRGFQATWFDNLFW